MIKLGDDNPHSADDNEIPDDTLPHPNNPHILEDISLMSMQELEQHVLSIRARRDAAAERINKARSVSRNAKDNALNFRLDKETAAAIKQLASINTALDKLEARVTKIRVTLIEMGEDVT